MVVDALYIPMETEIPGEKTQEAERDCLAKGGDRLG